MVLKTVFLLQKMDLNDIPLQYNEWNKTVDYCKQSTLHAHKHLIWLAAHSHWLELNIQRLQNHVNTNNRSYTKIPNLNFHVNRKIDFEIIGKMQYAHLQKWKLVT